MNEIIRDGHEQVILFNDKDSGLEAITAIHSSVLGPAMGGCRFYPYKNFNEALEDVLRLSKGMTYKASIAGINAGGGKSVIIGDPVELKKNPIKREHLFRSFGKCVQSLNGRYITAVDLGTDVQDMDFIRMETKYVSGVSVSLGGFSDPSPVTALGTYKSMRVCAEKLFGTPSLKGLKIIVQGIGNVGKIIVNYLYEEGANILISDINQNKVDQMLEKYKGIQFISEKAVYTTDVDIYSPCALGATINDQTIDKLRCKIIAGAANNQLKNEEKHGRMLYKRNILYATDYVINSGGLISVFTEFKGYKKQRALDQAERISDTIRGIIEYAESEKIPHFLAANRIAEERISTMRKLN